MNINMNINTNQIKCMLDPVDDNIYIQISVHICLYIFTYIKLNIFEIVECSRKRNSRIRFHKNTSEQEILWNSTK